MAVTNGGFEIGAGGSATGWTQTATATEEAYAEFSGGPTGEGFEDFESWPPSALLAAFQGYTIDVELAVFEPGAEQELFENFENAWGSYFIPVIAIEEAPFDSTTPESFEDFEEDWGAILFVLAPGDLTLASFDTTPEGFEDFEEDWGAASLKTSYPTWIAGSDLTAATFDNTGGGGGAADEFEPFDDTAWPTLTL